MTLQPTVRAVLLIESLSFLVAGAIHSGTFVVIDTHYQAAIAEGLIGSVLLIGFGLSWVWPVQTRLIGLLTQIFAACGTLVGLTTIAVGIGPRNVGDIAFHLAILAVLACGSVMTAVLDKPQSARAES
jgi:hypothetical protein